MLETFFIKLAKTEIQNEEFSQFTHFLCILFDLISLFVFDMNEFYSWDALQRNAYNTIVYYHFYLQTIRKPEFHGKSFRLLKYMYFYTRIRRFERESYKSS